jgi:hypothetical protein
MTARYTACLHGHRISPPPHNHTMRFLSRLNLGQNVCIHFLTTTHSILRVSMHRHLAKALTSVHYSQRRIKMHLSSWTLQAVEEDGTLCTPVLIGRLLEATNGWIKILKSSNSNECDASAGSDSPRTTSKQAMMNGWHCEQVTVLELMSWNVDDWIKRELLA